MPDIIKPIETIYKGYRFRSRLEARWAVFFDALGVTWQYEIEGYQLPSGPYLPDFLLPVAPGSRHFDVVEIKNESLHHTLGELPHPKEAIIADEMTNVPFVSHVYVFYGDPIFNLTNDGFFFKDSGAGTISICNIGFKSKTDITNAALKARQARFEHGETP